MTQLKKFNVKAGLSVGTSSIEVIDDGGNGTFNVLNNSDVGTTPQLWFKGHLSSDVTLTNIDNLIAWDEISNPKSWSWNNGSNKRLVPGRIGWYRVILKVNYNASAVSQTSQINTQIRMNGDSQSIAMSDNNQNNMRTIVNTTFVYASSVTDYFEFTAYTNVAGQTLQGTTQGSSVLVEWVSN